MYFLFFFYRTFYQIAARNIRALFSDLSLTVGASAWLNDTVGAVFVKGGEAVYIPLTKRRAETVECNQVESPGH